MDGVTTKRLLSHISVSGAAGKQQFGSCRTRSTGGSKVAVGPAARRLRNRIALFAAVAVSLVACTSGPAPTPKPTASATNVSKAPDGDRVRAEKTARKVLTTWARPEVPYKRWWADLEPLLSPEARDDYSYTDPTVIPALKIRGAGVEDSGPYDPWVATFYYPTSAGRFGVDLARSHQDGKWRAYSIVFPGQPSQRQ